MLKILNRARRAVWILQSRGLRGVNPEKSLSLEEKLAALNPTDAEQEARVDIGYYIPRVEKQIILENKERLVAWKKNKLDHSLLEKAATGNLIIDYDVQKEDWEKFFFRRQIKMAADHYGIYTDLFEYGFFYPTTVMKIHYPIPSSDEVTPVHTGNLILPQEASSPPKVHFKAQPEDMYTLLLTALDSHLETDGAEYLHWMVGNIPGNDISKGVTVCDYMQPFTPVGTGYHRFVYLLFKQETKLDFSKEQRSPKTLSLSERTFRTFDFYKERQDSITPCGISFFQSKWDDSLVDFFHNTLGLQVPVFEHVPLEKQVPIFKKFAENEPFNDYIDKFRDPKEIAEDIYTRRLKKLEPFAEEPEPLKFPHAHQMPWDIPTWLKKEITHERNFEGKFAHMKRFSLYPQPERKPFRKVLGPKEEEP